MLTFAFFAQIFGGVNEFCPLDKTCHPFLWETMASQSPVLFLHWKTHQEHLMAGLSPNFWSSKFEVWLKNFLCLHFPRWCCCSGNPHLRTTAWAHTGLAGGWGTRFMCQVSTKLISIWGAVNYLDKFPVSPMWQQAFVWAGGSQKSWG